MRSWMLVVLAIVLGAVMGYGLNVMELGSSSAGTVDADFARWSQDPATAKGPRLVVDDQEFDFGGMELNAEMSHKFSLRNAGNEPLKLSRGGVSCGHCTSYNILNEEIAPGETGVVEVKWKGINGGPFRQSATVETNDSQHSSQSFTITGKVHSAHRFSPEEIVFSNVSVTDSPTAELKVFSYHGPDLKVLEHEFTDKETADFFQIELKPMTPEELQTDPDAKSGVTATVKLKPGLPLGPIRQKIRLKLNLPDTPEVEVPVEGNVSSDIQIVGREEWNAERSLLNFGTISSAEGAKAEVYLLARGPHRQAVKPVVHSVEPKFLKVTIGTLTELGNGDTVRVPITVEIPKGMSPSLHLGNGQGEIGEVNIDTGHPDAKSLRMMVRFAVGT